MSRRPDGAEGGTAAPERALHGFCHALPKRWHGMAVVLSAAFSLEWVAGLTGNSSDIAGKRLHDVPQRDKTEE